MVLCCAAKRRAEKIATNEAPRGESSPPVGQQSFFKEGRYFSFGQIKDINYYRLKVHASPAMTL